MHAKQFLKTIYLGDRACKSIVMDGWSEQVKIQVDCISRVRGDNWNYYNKEDLVDGYIVFSGVKSIEFQPPGHIPNDLIHSLTAEDSVNASDLISFVLSVGSADFSGNCIEMQVRIMASDISLRDRLNPDVEIR